MNISTLHPIEAQIIARNNPDTVKRAKQLQLMAFDVDGVLTDGTLWYNEHGEAFKGFNALDGHGLRLLKESGIRVALITGRKGPIVTRRAAELGIDTVMQGIRNKKEAIIELAQNSGFSLEQTGFMGDDLIDLAAMQKVGFAASVPNAPDYVQQAAHWVANRNGGSGAARDCCDLILAAQGKLATFFAPHPMLLIGAIQ